MPVIISSYQPSHDQIVSGFEKVINEPLRKQAPKFLQP